MITINRKSSYTDKIRNYKIILDGDYWGDIEDGETKNINIVPGNHRICLKIDWCKSNEIEFTVSEGETITFECGNSMNGWKKLLSPFYVTFLKNKYLWIKINQ